MNEALKQRLVGAGVLLILAGLLWPLLFDFDEPVLELAPPSQIPPMVKVEPVIVQPARKRTTLKSHIQEKKESESKNASSAKQIAAKASATGSKVEVSSQDQGLSELIANLPKPPLPAGKDQYKDRLAKKDRPRLDANGIPVSFVVQIGTFKRWENADGLRDKLIKKQLKAYTRPANSASDGPYQVLVGPVLTYAQAEDVAADVKSRFKINDAIINRFRSQ